MTEGLQVHLFKVFLYSTQWLAFMYVCVFLLFTLSTRIEWIVSLKIICGRTIASINSRFLCVLHLDSIQGILLTAAQKLKCGDPGNEVVWSGFLWGLERSVSMYPMGMSIWSVLGYLVYIPSTFLNIQRYLALQWECTCRQCSDVSRF